MASWLRIGLSGFIVTAIIAAIGWLVARWRRPVLVLSVHVSVAQAPTEARGGGGFSASSSILSGPTPLAQAQIVKFFRVGVANRGGISCENVLIYLTRVTSIGGSSWRGELPLPWKDLRTADPRRIVPAGRVIEADLASQPKNFPHFLSLEAVNASSAIATLDVGLHTFELTAHGAGRMGVPTIEVTIENQGFWPDGAKIIKAVETHAGRLFGRSLTVLVGAG